MVKICVISPEVQKEKEKVEGLPAPEILTEIPLYEKLKLENGDDLAAIKNPKRRCKGMLVVMLVLIILVLSCLCLTAVVYSRNENVDEQEVPEHKETKRFEIEITFRDPDEALFEKEAQKSNFETTTPYQSTVNPVHHMKEEITIGNNTEVFSIPAGDDYEALIFLHDFTYEYTAYLLVDQDLCFIKDIDPFLLHPWVLFAVLMNPFYFAHEFIATRETFIAVPPPLYHLWKFGPEISALCGNAPTFWLEVMDNDNEYDIVDPSELPWFEWGYDRYDRRKRSVDNPMKPLMVLDPADERKAMRHTTIKFVNSKK